VVRPLPFLWPYALVFWVTYAWAALPELRLVRRSNALAGAQRTQDRGSVLIIRGGVLAGTLAAMILPFAWPAASFRVHRIAAFWCGLALLIAASLVRRHCFRTLGAHYTGVIRVERGQSIVEEGLYRWIRHPAYTAGFIGNAGIGLCFGNWAGLAAITAVTAAAYAYRIRLEEAALLAETGQAWRDYASRHKRFIPFLI
jgi:protein-S-isoprenylcysteine O-methyltransferase Ste14